jgi:hypothetical protein
MLAACEPTEIGPGAEKARTAAQREEAARPRVPVVLPPSISASKTYRCSDNSVLAVEFYSDRASATVRAGENGPPVRVKAPAPDGTMVADGGWSLKGGAKDAKVSITTPETRKPLSCHV